MSNAELAVLSLVAERPRHGYNIEQTIHQRGMRKWTEIGFSSIYYLLNRLEHSGKITSHAEPAAGKGPARKVYEVTHAGIESLIAELHSILIDPSPVKSPLLLGLANMPVIGEAQAVQALSSHRKKLQADLDEMLAVWEKQKPLPYNVDATFSYSRALIEAEIQWINGFLESRPSLLSTPAPRDVENNTLPDSSNS